MSSLVDAVADLLEGLEGVAEVRRYGLGAPKQSPALVVDLVSEVEDDPQELGAESLILRQTVMVSAVVRVTHLSLAPAARDLALTLARGARRALAADPTLGGACLTSRAGETEHAYPKIDGQDYSLAVTPIEALIEEAL